MVARDPERDREAVARGCRELRQARRIFSAQHELAVRKIEVARKW